MRRPAWLLAVLVAGSFALPVGTASAAEVTVEMLGHSFMPDEVNIRTGDTVTWVNVEDHDDLHTVTSQDGGPLDSGTIARGDSFTFTFTSAGNYPYLCTVHDNMFGIVRVRDPGVPFAADDALALTKGDDPASGSVDVLANDQDLEGDPLTVSAFDATGADGGSVACTPSGTCTYTQPQGAGCPATDSFTYTVSDGARSDRATVAVTVDCARPPPPADAVVSLRLTRHLVARGEVTSKVAACEQARRVKLQRRKPSGRWVTLVTVTTSGAGRYEARLNDRPGLYRAKAGAATLASGQVCAAASSAVRRHRH